MKVILVMTKNTSMIMILMYNNEIYVCEMPEMPTYIVRND